MGGDVSMQMPYFIFLLFLLPFLFLGFVSLSRARKETLRPFGALVLSRNLPLFWGRVLCILLSFFFAVVALMSPVRSRRPTPSSKEERALSHVILLADTSLSQAVPDMPGGKSRLEYTKELFDALCATLKGEQVALYAFTTEAVQLSPLTPDPLFVRFMISQMDFDDVPVQGTDLVESVGEVRKRFLKKGVERATILIATDGGEHKKEGEKRALTALLSFSPPLDWNVIFVGTGSVEGGEIPGFKGVRSSLNQPFLQEVARRVEGSYFQGAEWPVIELAQKLQEMTFVKQGEQIATANVRSTQTHLFMYPLGAALFFLVTGLILPQTLEQKKGLFLLLFFFLLPLEGTPRQVSFEEAGLYLQAEEMVRQKLRMEDQWEQRDASYYNLGRLKMSQKKWDEALEAFASIGTVPYFDRDLSYNRAFSFYQLALTSQTLSERIVYLKKAARLFFYLGKEGRVGYQNVQVTLDQSLEEYEAEKMKRMTPRQALFSLQRGQDTLALQAKRIEAHPQYKPLFLQEMRGWLPVWEQATRQDGNVQEIFDRYLQAIEAFDKGEDVLGRTILLSIKEELVSALPVPTPDKEVDFFIETLFLAATERPLQLSRLLPLQLDLEKIVKGTFPEISHTVMRDFKAGLKALDKGDWVTAHLLFFIVLQSVIAAQEEETTKLELQRLIRLQTWLVEMYRLRFDHPLLARGRFLSLQGGESLIRQVKKEQGKGNSDCSCPPWDLVLPLYFSGRERVKWPRTGTLGLIDQEIALRMWKKALDKLLKTKEKEKERELFKRKTDISIEKTIRELIQMHAEDRLQRKGRPQRDGVKRPW